MSEFADELQAEVRRDARAAKAMPTRLPGRGVCLRCGKHSLRRNGGRCPPCRTYLDHMGKERPERLWKAAGATNDDGGGVGPKRRGRPQGDGKAATRRGAE